MGNCYMLIAVSVLASLSSSHGSQVITTLFGKTATLPCQISNLDSDLQSLYWRKDGTIIYSRTSTRGNGKYSVTDTASLVIPDVMESDAGNYSCIVKIWKSSTTMESDIMQLYAIDISVSHCKDTGQKVDGCSCSINGSNITSLGCYASGFTQPPVVTWEEDRIIYQSSSVDLTRFSENTTLTCKARDENLKGAVANKTVCVYYSREVPSTGEPPVETTTASVNVQALFAVIIVLGLVVSIILILLLMICLAAAYRWKKGEAFRLPPIFTRTSTVVGDKQQLSSVGLVLLNDLRSAPEETKESIKAAVVALVVDPNKIHWSHVDPNVTIHSLFIDMRSVKTGDLGDPDAAFDLDRILDERDRDECEMLITNPDFQEVTDGSQVPTYQGSRVIHQSLPMQANMTSSMPSSMVEWSRTSSALRGELVKKLSGRTQIFLDFLETGHSGLRGNSYLNRSTPMLPSLPMQASMTSSVTKLSERTAIRNAMSQIIQDFLETGHSGLRGNSRSNCSTPMLPSLPMPANMTSSMSSSMVVCNPLYSAFIRGELQSSERLAAICTAISQNILDFLETGHSRLNCSTALLPSSVSDPVVQTRQEEG